jgi:YYY domain-containing protein
MGASSLALGAIIATNTWDVPAFWGIYAVCGLLSVYYASPLERSHVLSRLGWTFIGAVILFVPYLAVASTPPLGLGLVAERTPLISLLIVFGFLLLMPFLGAAWLWKHGYASSGLNRLRKAPTSLRWLFGIAGVALFVSLAFLQEPTLLFLLAALVLLLPGAMGLLTREVQRPSQPAVMFASILFAVSIAILLAGELVYLSDAFQSRMNTVFKLHYNVWLLLGVASAVVLAALVGRPAMEASRLLRAAAVTAIALLLATGLVYPFAATYSKSERFAGRPTLNGAHLLAARHPGDYAVVDWLQRNVRGRPVVLEAVGGDYSEYGRISTFAGIPTILGWPGHELQWRGAIGEIGVRESDVQIAYSSDDRDEVRDILRRYRVQYVVVGNLERAQYGPDAADRFAGWLPLAYQQGGTLLFRVPEHDDLLLTGGDASA